ncbi:hypothetical protein Tco_1534316 [Tanacetum coccineum]
MLISKTKLTKLKNHTNGAPDEWYYEGIIKDYKYWKAEEEKEANKKCLLELAKDHKKQLASMLHLNLFGDQSYDDSFYSGKENFEASDYEDA